MKRRDFFKTAAVTAIVPTVIPAAALGRDGRTAPSETITLGGIGINQRGGYVLGYFLAQPDVRFRAVADVRRDRREAVKRQADERYGVTDTAMYRDFHELLELDGIDAVLIATGDRWHTDVSIAAANAGKDIYCEKPCGLTIGHCQRLADCVNQTGVVFQGGTQRRNVVNARYACQLARSGKLGEIKTVHASIYYLQSRTDWLAAEPLPNRDEIDWNLWLGPAPWRPFHHAYVNGQWRAQYDFDSGAKMLDWGAHTVDLCQMALGKDGTTPTRYWSEGNRLYARYDDGVNLIMRPDGWRGLGTCPVRFEGTEGWVEVGDSGRIALSDPKLRPTIQHLLKKDPANRLSLGECPAGHVRDFLDCVKTRRQPAANVNVIRSSHVACHAAALSWILRRELEFDPAKEEFINDPEANRLRFRASRLDADGGLPPETPEKRDDDGTLHAEANRLIDLTRIGTEADAPAIDADLDNPYLSTHAATARLNLPGEARDAFYAERTAAALKAKEAKPRFAELPELTILPPPTLEELVALLDALNGRLTAEEILQKYDAARLLCRRSNVPDLWAERIADYARSRPSGAAVTGEVKEADRASLPEYLTRKPGSESLRFLAMTLLADLESAGALKEIAAFARSSGSAVSQCAVERLGEWPNIDAAPTLLELIESVADEKNRSRLVRGYLRLVRQMTDIPAEKLAMIEKLAPLPLRDEERRLAEELTKNVEAARRDRLIFDGESFDGWEGAVETVFHIEDGAIVAGSSDRPNERNEFLTTVEDYEDFTLELECRIEGEGGNAGVQFRSRRIPNHHEMIGYQADMTTDGVYWGRLYDESRRNRFLVETNERTVKEIYRPNDWNTYKIVCWGDRIKIYLNGTLTADYTETEFPAEAGKIGLQIHAGPPSRAFYRHIRLERYVRRTFE